jgi:hypothetical protein
LIGGRNYRPPPAMRSLTMTTETIRPIQTGETVPRTTPKVLLESVLVRIDEVIDVLALYQAARCAKDVSALGLAERELELIRQELDSLASDLAE